MIDLTVKTLDSQNHVFSLEDDQITVRGFKEYIAESVAVPADSQRLIYCGRVLQDEKKLNDYDVNGKVLHLVQRAPPQHGQRGNDSGQQAQGQNNRQQQRSHYRLTRAQMHGNAMYLGAMSVPAEFVEGHGIPQLSNSLSGSRLTHAGRMLDRINELIDRLDDPNAPLHPTPSELSDYAQPQVQQHQQLITQETEAEQDENVDVARDDGSARIAEAAAAAVTAALSAAGARAFTLFRGGNYNSTEGGRIATSDATDNQSDTPAPSQQRQQPQQQQQQQAQPATEQSGATSSNAGQNRRAQQQDLPRPPQMAELLQRLYNTQDRLRPYLERYCVLTLVDPSLPPGPGPNTVEESQRIVDGVSEILHYMSHTCHALSDIIIDMSQPPPRNLRCRPIIVQHSAILQPGIPIQVEAHISLNGRGVNNNNTNDETTEAGNQQTQSDNNSESTNASHVHTEESGQERESDNTTQSQSERPQQEQGQSPFMLNLPNNVEVLMEVSSESNIDDGANNEQNTPGEGNNGGNTRRTGVFPFSPAPPPYFMRNFMQAVAGHMVHGGFGATTISTSRNPPATTMSQSAPASMDSGNSNSGQSTQARSNVGTHPTTATQTRSTSRPHVFHHHAHPVGLGMSIGLGMDFDPYLPCNSHHVYRMPTSTSSTSVNSGVTSQTTRTTPTTTTTTADAPPSQVQTATTSTSTSASATSTTGTSTTNANLSNSNLLGNLLQQMLGAGGRSQPNIGVNSNVPESLGNIMQMLGSRNIHVGYVSDRNSIGDFSLADLFESGGLNMHLSASPEENLLFDLFVLGAQNMTVDGIVRLSFGEWEPISRLRSPLRDFLWPIFSEDALSQRGIRQEATEAVITQLRPYLQELLLSDEDSISDPRIDICATVERLIARHLMDIFRNLFDFTYEDRWFAQDTLDMIQSLGRQLCAVLRYSIRGGQAGLEAIVSRFLSNRLEGSPPALRQWILDGFIEHFRAYSMRVPQPLDLEILPLLLYEDSRRQSSAQSSASARPSTQAPAEDEPMETETLEQRQTHESSAVPEDREEVPETFTGHEALPSDWVPIIARDGVRQRRQLQMQGVTNSGMTTFSDAYLGGLPTKRRKLIEQQKPRLLVSPTPNHSTIAASMERLVREGVGRAGVEEVEGAAVAVAADPAVRRAFGQAIRDCLNPCRYGNADFPDPLRFPNATKYFADQERPPK